MTIADAVMVGGVAAMIGSGTGSASNTLAKTEYGCAPIIFSTVPSGKIIKNPCLNCKGDGRNKQQSSILLEVPTGVNSGNYLTKRGVGCFYKYLF